MFELTVCYYLVYIIIRYYFVYILYYIKLLIIILYYIKLRVVARGHLYNIFLYFV